MNLETDCASCHGTMTIPAFHGNDWMAHAYRDICECSAGNLPVPGVTRYGGNHHKLALVQAHGAVAWVDEELAGDIERLWGSGIGTFSSCQGGIQGYERRYVMIMGHSRAELAMEMLPWAVSSGSREIGTLIYGKEE